MKPMDSKWWTLLAVCAGMFMLLLDVTIVVVAQPAIQDGLHASFTDVQWVLDSYALTLASLLLTAGVLADRYGRKLLFQIGLVIFTLGSLLCGVAQDPLMLIVSRSGQGVGGAIMFATSLALLGQSFRGRDRGVAFGVWGAVTGVSTALGPVLGGVITTNWSWRGIFLVNVLGYSAQGAGLRLAIISGAQLLSAVVAGRVSERVPARWLIGPGLVLVGVGLIIMGGLTGTSDWTHLIPGFIVSGFGGGMVNPPLASTAIGVVPPQKAGMASGVNSTFRQIGIAAGIAALGSIFNSALQHSLSGAPAVGPAAARIATMVRQGQVGQLLASLPPARRGVVAEAVRSGFAAGLNDLLIVTAVLAFVGAASALLLIRKQDFVRTGEPQAAAVPGAAAGADSSSPARSA